jgi:hypothetical protein
MITFPTRSEVEATGIGRFRLSSSQPSRSVGARVSLRVGELRLRACADRPVRTGRAASADGSLMMITLDTVWRGAEVE